MLRYWDAQTIASEILRRYNAKKALHYTGVADDNLSLLRAATRYFGSWEAAITFAGLDYDEIRLYKVWTRMRIIARIRELWQKGEDLSWRHVSMTLDPQLAGAATKKKHFGSWSRALEAAGLDYDLISRYIRWSDERILEKVREFHNGGRRMNAKKMEAEEIALLTAARRRFGSWPQALQAAGLQASEIVLRASFKGHQIFQPPITQGKRSPSRPPTVKNQGAASLNPQTQKLPAKNTKKNTLEHDASQHATTQNTTPNNDATQNGATTNRNLQSQRNATAKTAKRNAALKSVVGESAVSESVTVKKVSVAKTLQKTPETSRVKPERQAQNATRASTVAAPKAVKPKVATLKVAESKAGLNTPNVTIVKSLQVQALNSKTP